MQGRNLLDFVLEAELGTAGRVVAEGWTPSSPRALRCFARLAKGEAILVRPEGHVGVITRRPGLPWRR